MDESSALKTDLYELTMAAGYFQSGRHPYRATFELYCHTLPPERPYLLACGLEQVVEYILNLKFTDEDIAFLKSQPVFRSVDPAFFDYLARFRFSGDVWAVPEGEIVFADEPILQVEAPIIEAQILETYVLSMMNIGSLVATKASRILAAACGDGVCRSVVDFGSRRAHGPQAALLAARAAYVAGCIGTSNVHAGKAFGIPTFGTMAHSWVQAFEREEEAFTQYHEIFPDHATLLLDTYDTVQAAKGVVRFGRGLKGVRIDSGNLEVLSKRVRKILDQHNLKGVQIVASGNLNEFKIAKLIKARAPIDIFGVGTDMVISRDVPALDLTYKLVQVSAPDGQVRFTAKRSQGKHTTPGRKQIFRHLTAKGRMVKDTIGLCSEKPPPSAQPLLSPVIREGKLIAPLPHITAIRKGVRERLTQLPPSFHSFRPAKSYPVSYSPTITRLRNRVYKG